MEISEGRRNSRISSGLGAPAAVDTSYKASTYNVSFLGAFVSVAFLYDAATWYPMSCASPLSVHAHARAVVMLLTFSYYTLPPPPSYLRFFCRLLSHRWTSINDFASSQSLTLSPSSRSASEAALASAEANATVKTATADAEANASSS